MVELKARDMAWIVQLQRQERPVKKIWTVSRSKETLLHNSDHCNDIRDKNGDT